MAEGSTFGVDGIRVGGVGDDVNLTTTAAVGVAAEANGAVCEALAVGAPVSGGAAPAVVDWVTG